MSISLITTYFENKSPTLSLHEDALGKFLTGKDLTSYICTIERSLEGRSKSLKFNELSSKELQGILLLTLALWQKTNDSDYCKLFIQVLPHYIESIHLAKNEVSSILTHDREGDLKAEIVDVVNAKPRGSVTKEQEYSNLRALVNKYITRECLEDVSETLAEALVDWSKISHSEKQFQHIAAQACRICLRKKSPHQPEDFFSFYKNVCTHFLKCTNNPNFLMNNCFQGCSKEFMEEHILSSKSLRELYTTITSHAAFSRETRHELVEWSISNGWFSHAIAIGSKLSENQVGRLQVLIENIYEQSSELLQAPWQPVEDPKLYQYALEGFIELANDKSCSSHKYILLHKIEAKRELILSDSRSLHVKETASLYSRK